jgi:hypothetical protein
MIDHMDPYGPYGDCGEANGKSLQEKKAIGAPGSNMEDLGIQS